MSQSYHIQAAQHTGRFLKIVRFAHGLVVLYALTVLLLSFEGADNEVHLHSLKTFRSGLALSLPLIFASCSSLISLVFNKFYSLSLCSSFFTFLGTLALTPVLALAAFPLLIFFVLLYGASIVLFFSKIRECWAKENPAFRELTRSNALSKPHS